MANKKSEKKVRNALQKHLDTMFTEEEQMDIGFHTDVETDTHYIWRMEAQGQTIHLKYEYATETIQVVNAQKC